MHDGRGMPLKVLANGVISFPQERAALGGFDKSDVVCQGERIPI